MILTLFWAIFLISIVLIALGIIFSEEWSGVAIVGFTFLFLLSLVILQGNLEVQSGMNVTTAYSYDLNGSVNGSIQSVNYEYNNWTEGTSHTVGYFMAIISATSAFSCVLITLTKWGKK